MVFLDLSPFDQDLAHPHQGMLDPTELVREVGQADMFLGGGSGFVLHGDIPAGAVEPELEEPGAVGVEFARPDVFDDQGLAVLNGQLGGFARVSPPKAGWSSG